MVALHIAILPRLAFTLTQLLSEAIAYSPQLQLSTLLAFVFAHNQPSLNLFAKYGFERWGYLPDIAQLDRIQRSLVVSGRNI